MRAAVCKEAGAPCVAEEIPVPTPTGRHLLVKVKAASLCQTDLTVMSGKVGTHWFPLVPGHEAVCVVVQVPEEAEPWGFQVGDLVGAPLWCEFCLECRSYKSERFEYCAQMKAKGVHEAGFFSEYTTLDAASAVLVTRNFGVNALLQGLDRRLSPIFCAGITVWDGLAQAKLGVSESVGVVGAGGLGQLATAYLTTLGYKVVVMDVQEKQLIACKEEYPGVETINSASIRYQLCEIVYVLALANKMYTPSFRGGYLQQAQKKVIYKYCPKKVLNYWKWECLWGKLSTDYEPVKKDNIMLTDFLLLAIGLYESATGDHTFSQDNALELIIDDNHRYRHAARTLAQALMGNFSISSYCLYPCEDESGSAHPIRSYPTGLRLPNIVGAANEFSVSCLAGANFPDLSLRCYAIARHEYMEFDSQYRVSYKNIQNGDRLDPGNYGTSMALVFSSSLMAAHEHGDEEVARQITTLIDNDQALQRTEKDGVVWYEGVSLFMKCQLLRSRLWLRSGWSRFLQPLSDAVQRGPYLADVNYAEALVAKAISSTGDDLDIVLYPGAESKSTSISIKQLKPKLRVRD
ncbi:Alcohol dehydrogenase 2 [Fusarium culmorum]|uniref:Alcohol dehydrogenase 2 n=1 Tax=Fusarium culmorum TaxID=5516 RepID=A0A2T4GS66_FUSCU|nr:Alcohol dehydrogenase 2 [Fusarium culmorum]